MGLGSGIRDPEKTTPDPGSRGQKQGCGSGLDQDSIGSVDPDPGGQKLPTKVEIFCKSSCFEVLDGLF